jgi:SAM-dependent methyltransferase
MNNSGTRSVNWHMRFLQQAGWTRDLRKYLFDRFGLDQAENVLEVGCGTGAVLAELHTRGRIHGLDLDPHRLAQAQIHAPAAEYTCANAQEMPYTAGLFDIVFCHYLFLWVKDPLQVLREMMRVARPGAYVAAIAEPDYGSRIDLPETLSQLGHWQTESLRRQGANPGFGSSLAGLFRQAGITLIEAGKLQEARQSSLSPAERQIEWDVLESDLAGWVSPAEIRRMKILDEEAWQQGKRRLLVPTYFAWGRVPPMV